MGATTTWGRVGIPFFQMEKNFRIEMNFMNHYAYGAIEDFTLSEKMVGINLPDVEDDTKHIKFLLNIQNS